MQIAFSDVPMMPVYSKSLAGCLINLYQADVFKTRLL